MRRVAGDGFVGDGGWFARGPGFLGSSFTLRARLEEGCGSAEHVGGGGFVAMVGVFVVASDGGVFGILEVAVRLAVGRMWA